MATVTVPEQSWSPCLGRTTEEEVNRLAGSVAIDVISTLPAVIAKQDSHPVPDGFVDHLHKFELDDFSHF